MTDRITITFCRPCGYERRASDAAQRLEQELGRQAELIPGTGGIFEVSLGGQVVAKRVRGHFPDAAEIVAAVRAAL